MLRSTKLEPDLLHGLNISVEDNYIGTVRTKALFIYVLASLAAYSLEICMKLSTACLGTGTGSIFPAELDQILPGNW